MKRGNLRPANRAGAKLRSALALAAGGACLGAIVASANPPPVVAVTTLPQKYFVDRLTDGRVQTEVMIPPGASPASYEPGFRELRALHRARLYLKLGHPHFPFEEAWLAPLLAGRPDLPVTNLAAGLDGLDDDPHLWVSPGITRSLCRRTAEALGQSFPEHAVLLEVQLASLELEIESLSEDLRALFASHQGERFFVFHPAWGAFAKEFGLIQVAIEEHHKEPGVRELARRMDEARRAGVRVIYAQPQFSPASARVIAKELGARIEFLDPLAYDWPENLRRVAERIREGLVP